MIQVVVPGLRIGHQFKAGENLLQGTVAYVSGIHTDGYFLLKNPRTATTAAMSIYPFSKYTYREDLSDYSANVGETEIIASGDPLIAFEGGEYITDRFMSNPSYGAGVGTAGIGSHTSSQFFMDNIWIDSATNPRPLLVTDTAAYSEGAGRMVYLWPSTALATKGYLRVSTANDTLCGAAATGYYARYNKNFLLVKTWSRGHLGFAGNAVQFKVIGKDAFSGRYWTGVSTAAYYNVAIING